VGACVAGLFGVAAALLPKRNDVARVTPRAAAPPRQPRFVSNHPIMKARDSTTAVATPTVVFDIANSDYFEPADVPNVDDKVVERGWQPTSLHQSIASVLSVCECEYKETHNAEPAIWANVQGRLSKLKNDKDDQPERSILLSLLQHRTSIVAARRDLFPAFDVVITNNDANPLIIQSVETRVSAFMRFAGDAGDVPTGRVIPTADEVLVRLPSVKAYGDGTFRFKDALTRSFRTKSIAVPAHGVAQVRVVVTMGEPSGRYELTLRFQTSLGKLETTPFSLSMY